MCIDFIDVSEGLMPFIEGFEAIELDENSSADHRRHGVELNLEKFFNENLHELDQVSRSKLDSSRKSRKETFLLKIEVQLNFVMLEERTSQFDQRRSSKRELERTDVEITRFLNNARKKVEGRGEGVPYSREKLL